MTQPRAGDRASRSPEVTYRQRCAEFGELRDTYSRRSSLNGNVSLALLALLLVGLGAWLWRGESIWLAATGLLALSFVVSFAHHGRVNETLRRYAELYAINAEGLARLRRDWSALPLRQPPDPKPHAPSPEAEPATPGDGRPTADDRQRALAADLDLLGHASLQHLLGTPATTIGLATLRDWLLTPAAPATARERQDGVAELASLNDFRDQVALRGRLVGSAQGRAAEHAYERFLGWAESRALLPERRWLLGLARALPLLALALALAQLLGLTNLPLWLAPLAAGVALTATVGRAVDATIDMVAEQQGVFTTYAEIFRLVEAQPFAAPALARLQGDLAAGHLRADQQMRRLNRLMALADLRGWMFFYPIQIATLWNVHVLWLLERWQREAGPSARRWLAVLGELEALAALAALAHDNPAWAFPELLDPRATDGPAVAAPRLEARDLGHPLLAPDVCVGNDVAVGPPGTFLLVTGSNMSGKSTLLRSIGVNVTLAQAGGPVCAASLRMPPIALATSMRVQDSLEQGVSYFMAELRRLKDVVDAAEQARERGERLLLFLLDEILHGTNTAERQIAARQIILHLIGSGATGAVSTHDLTLAEAPELAARAEMVHFAEQFARGAAGPSMRFDYRLRPGIATSTNALKLMEMIGLPLGGA